MLQEQNYEFNISLTMDDVMHSSSVSIFSSQVNALYKYQAIFYIIIYLLGGKFCQDHRYSWSPIIYRKYFFSTCRCGSRIKISALLKISLASNNNNISTICQRKLLVDNRGNKVYDQTTVSTFIMYIYVQCIDNFTEGFLCYNMI